MAIRFKFRSSVNFDSIDIEGRPSISVRDLRSKIVQHKNLHISQDLDLIFSDFVTGQVFDDDNFQISSGSSIIIKRVPAGSARSIFTGCINSAENSGVKDSNPIGVIASHCANVEVDDFDDFGVDLCPVPETSVFDCDLEIGNDDCIIGEKSNIEVPRCLEPFILRCQKLEASDLSEAIPKDMAHHGFEGDVSRTELKPKVDEHKKLEMVVNTNTPSLQNNDLSSELKCFLCDSFFKDAVMIPCCQHSFCEKCIRAVLVEKARCPKCYSTKCKVEDLLPNVSLRQAIDHFLESQIPISGSDNAFHGHAPDGESGIQAKEVSCAVSILQREPDFLHSSSETGQGSNQIIGESAYESLIGNNASDCATGSRINHLGSGKSFKSAPSSHRIKHGERDGNIHLSDFKYGSQDFLAVSDFQGENHPVNLPQSHKRDRADPTIKKKMGMQDNTAGGDKSYMEMGRHKKGGRTCYMCGSPDHFMRDCPASAIPHPMLQTGNAMFPRAMPGYVPYWNGTPMPHMRPFPNLYGNPGMMPFNATMAPGLSFAVPPYVASMYSGSPVFNNFRRAGNGVVGTSGECSPLEFLDFQDYGNRRKHSNENMERKQSRDDDDSDFGMPRRCNEKEKSHDNKSRRYSENSGYSEDSFPQRSQKKHGHDDDFHSGDETYEKSRHSSHGASARRPHHPERSSSGIEDEERHVYHHRSLKNYNERRELYDSDSSRGHHRSSDSSRRHHRKNKEKDVKRRVESDMKKNDHKHQKLHSGSGLQPSSSSDRKKQWGEDGSSHSSRHRKQNAEYVSHDRWQMFSGTDEEDCRKYSRGLHKRRRVH